MKTSPAALFVLLALSTRTTVAFVTFSAGREQRSSVELNLFLSGRTLKQKFFGTSDEEVANDEPNNPGPNNHEPSALKQKFFGQTAEEQLANDYKHGPSCPCCRGSPDLFAPHTSQKPKTLLASSLVLPQQQASSTLTTFESAVDTHFAGSLPASQVTGVVHKTLKRISYTQKNTLFATSICPDEINTKPKSLHASLNKALTKKKTGVFTLGGLAGLPFVGVTGLKAFLSHVPENGNVLIYFGPHVGISESGIVGKLERIGQESSMTSSCGAALGAYKAIQSSKTNPSHGAIDFQEDYIISQLRPKLSSASNDNAVSEQGMPSLVTKQVYGLIANMLKEELKACWKDDAAFWDKIGQVTLLGGIIINRSGDAEDYFQPLAFETYSRPLEQEEGSSPQKTNWLAYV